MIQRQSSEKEWGSRNRTLLSQARTLAGQGLQKMEAAMADLTCAFVEVRTKILGRSSSGLGKRNDH